MSREYVLITGAASDIGCSIAVELSKDHDLVLTDVIEERLDEVMQQCDPQAEVKKVVLRLDELDELQGQLEDFLKAEGITISKYVHCAGIAKSVPLKVIKPNDFVDAFKVNVVSSAMIVKSLTSRKNKKALRSCVLLASTSAIRGVKSFSAYGATKAGVVGLARNLAIELAPACRVNSISPGAIRTRATKEGMDAREEVFQSKYPLGMGVPEKLTGTVRFLLSDDADWITGQNIIVDGGRTTDGTD